MLHVCLQCTRKSRLNNHTKVVSKKTPSTVDTSRLSSTMMWVTTFCLSCPYILLRLDLQRTMNSTNFLPHSWWLNYTGSRQIKLDIAKIIQVPSATASGHITSKLCPPWSWDNWAVANEHRKLPYTGIYLAVSLDQSNKFVAPFSCNYLVYWGHIVLKSQYCQIQLQPLH